MREVRRRLTAKLGFELDAGRRHPTFLFRHGGRIVAKTHISHGRGGEVSDGVISAMARQLGVSGPQLRDAIGCAMPREAFASLLLSSAL